jgi:hypothetical protein
MSAAKKQKKPHKATFEEVVQSQLKGVAPELLPEAEMVICEDVRLMFEHPNEYVAYIDSLKSTPQGRVVVRKIIALDPDYQQVARAVEALSPSQLRRVVIRSIPDPNCRTVRIAGIEYELLDE